MPVHFASDSPSPNGGGGGDAQGSVWGNLRLMLGQPSFSDQQHGHIQQPEVLSDAELQLAQQKKAVGFLRPFSAARKNEVLRLGPEQEEEVAQVPGAKDWKTFVAGWLADEEEAPASVDRPNGTVTMGTNGALAELAGNGPSSVGGPTEAPTAAAFAIPKSAIRKPITRGVSAAPKGRAKSAIRRPGATSVPQPVIVEDEGYKEEEEDDAAPAEKGIIKKKKKKKERDRKNPFVMPALHTFAFENLVHNIVWRVGRNFGFQAFNVNPRTRNRGHNAEWTPATIFVAGDHLTQLLVKNYFIRRDKGEDERQEERFAKAVFELHTTIFYSYEEYWTHMHGLSIRPMAMQEVLSKHRFCDEAVVCGLLTELALYFLIYSESSSMRHTPELLWFLYWCMNHSYVMQDMWGRDPPENFPNIREVRIGLRNKHQALIRELQHTLGIYPDRIRPEDCGRLAPIMSRLKASDVPEEQRIITADLIAFGDGNFYYERIVTPIFYVISYEIDHLSNLGVEVAHRLGYDDINESMAHTGVVRLALRDMRVRGEQIIRGEVNEAYNTITRLGYTRGRAETNFDPQVAADWWRSNVFVKTYRERRTWLAVFRAYYRVFTWHLVLYHAMQAQAFVGWNWRMISSCIITHAFCTALERFSNWYMTRNPREPLQTALSKVFDKKGNFKISRRANAQALAAARAIGFGESKAIGSENVRMEPVRVVEIEGSPYLGTLGLVEWVILAFFILGWYVLQFYEGPFQPFCRAYWPLFSYCYTGAFALHFLLTTRDGYAISLTHAFNLGPILKASSSRPDPANWIMGTMHMKWKLFFLDALFWIIAFAMKIPFDYYIICQPSVEPLQLTFKVGWLGCPHDEKGRHRYWNVVPCLGGDWVLAFVRLAPFVIVVLLDTSLFYQVSTTLFGLFRGLFKLDLGVLTAWEEVVKEFYKAPYRWWFKCMSEVGNRNQLTLLKTMLFDNAADPETGAIVSDGRMFKKAVLTPEEIMGTKKRSVNVAAVLDGDDDDDNAAGGAGQGHRGGPGAKAAAGKDATGSKGTATGGKGSDNKPLSTGWKTALQNFGLRSDQQQQQQQQQQKPQPKIGPKGGPLLPTTTNMKAMQKQLNQMQRLPVKLPMTTITERMLANTERQRDGADAAAGNKPKLASVAEKLLGNKTGGGAAAAAAKLKDLSPEEKRKEIISRIQAAQRLRKEGGAGGGGDAPSAAGLPAGDLMTGGAGGGGTAAGMLVNAPPSPQRAGPQVRWGRAMAAVAAARQNDEDEGGAGGEPRRGLLTMDAKSPDEPTKAPDEEEALRPFSAGTVGADSRKVLLPHAGRTASSDSSDGERAGSSGAVKAGASLLMPVEEVDSEMDSADKDKPASAGSAATPATLERAAVLNPTINSTQHRASTPTLFGGAGRMGGSGADGAVGTGPSLDGVGAMSSQNRNQARMVLDPLLPAPATQPALAPDRSDSFGFGTSGSGRRDLPQNWPSLQGGSGGSSGSARISTGGAPLQPPQTPGLLTVGSMESPARYSWTGAPSDAEAMARTLSSNRQAAEAARVSLSPGGGSIPRPSRLRNKGKTESADMGEYQPVASPRLGTPTGASQLDDVDDGDLTESYQGYNRVFGEQGGRPTAGTAAPAPSSPERGTTPTMPRPVRISPRSPKRPLGDDVDGSRGGGADLLRVASMGPTEAHPGAAQGRDIAPTIKPGSGGTAPAGPAGSGGPRSPPGSGGGRVSGPGGSMTRFSSNGSGPRPGPVAESLADRIGSGLEAAAGSWTALAQSGVGPLMSGADSVLAWHEDEDAAVASWWTRRLEAAKARSYRMRTSAIDEDREVAALSSMTAFRPDGDPLAMVYEWRVEDAGVIAAATADRDADRSGSSTDGDERWVKGAAGVAEGLEAGADDQAEIHGHLTPRLGARKAAELPALRTVASCSSSDATAGVGNSGSYASGSGSYQSGNGAPPLGWAAIHDAPRRARPIAEATQTGGSDRLGSPDLLGTPLRYNPPAAEDIDLGHAHALAKKLSQDDDEKEGDAGGTLVRSVSGTSLRGTFFKDITDDDAPESIRPAPIKLKSRLKLEPIKFSEGDDASAAGPDVGVARGDGGVESGHSSLMAGGKSGRRRSVAFGGQKVEEYTVPSGSERAESPSVALVGSGSNRMTSSTGQDRPMTAGDGENGIMSRWLAGLSGWTGLSGNKVSPAGQEDDEAADEEAAVRAARQLQGGGEAAPGGQGSKAGSGQGSKAGSGQGSKQAGGRSFRASFRLAAPSFRAGIASFRASGGGAQPTGAGQGRPTTSLPRSVQARSQAMGPPGLRPGSAMRPLTALRPTTAMRPTTARPMTALLGNDLAKEAKRKEKKDREQAIERAAGTLARSDSLVIIDGADPDEDEEIDEVHAQMMMWNAFAFAWDEIVDDLRQADYVNDKEVSMLKFVRLDMGSRGHGLRPILLPTFFYAGQVRKVVDTGQVSTAQIMVLNELRVLVVWLGCQVGLLSGKHAHVITSAPFVRGNINVKHALLRKKMLTHGLKLVDQLEQICERREVPFDMKEIADNLYQLWVSLEGECFAIHKAAERHRATAEDVELASIMFEVVSDMKQVISSDPEGLKAVMKTALLNNATADYKELLRVIRVIKRMLVTTEAEATPQSEESQRILGFFINSLGHPSLDKPPSIDKMWSWSIMTPLYEEDVLYALDAKALAKELGLKNKKMTDLLSETDDSISLMSYLKAMFPYEWSNFKERMKSLNPDVNVMDLSEHDFAPGCEMHEFKLELQMWASLRGQLLARTVHGMMLNEVSLRVLAKLEHPMPPNMTETEYKRYIDQLVNCKFEYVVTPQTYGKNRASKDLRLRWLASSIDILMQKYPRLKVAFLDHAETDNGPLQFSVMARGRDLNDPAQLALLTATGIQEDENGVIEWYRVRLPLNKYSGRGVIIGEGKPENQNHAVIFAFGEGLQAIDMNQDNVLAETLKSRNLVQELLPSTKGVFHLFADDDEVVQITRKTIAAELLYVMRMRQAACTFTALVGFREWIFSDKAGALGRFAAATEYAFGTITQRTLTHPARIRLHYGHPDLFNKMFVMTRGGISKATRQLHLTEDVFCGCNHTLRGGRIRYKEYISCGKGRDMGFDSINGFNFKIAGGGGEWAISRESCRLGARLDFFRLLMFYHSCIGFYINSWLTTQAAFWNIYALLIFNMAKASHMSDMLQRIYNVQQVLQLGTLAMIPYIGQLILELGVVKAALTVFQQILTGSLFFYMFQQQTVASSFIADMTYGSAKYVGTGRGFNITALDFVKIYTLYARSHLYYAFELLSMLIAMYVVRGCEVCNYGSLTWSGWLLAFVLIFAPLWFNPFSFDIAKVKVNYLSWQRWMHGDVDPGTGTNWYTWNSGMLEKMRNDNGNNTDNWVNIAFVGVGCLPYILLTVCAASRLDIVMPAAAAFHPIFKSQIFVFIVATVSIWIFVHVSIQIKTYFTELADHKPYRIYRYLVTICLVIFLILWLAVVSRWYDGSGFNTLCIILYANFQLLVAYHKFVTVALSQNNKMRAFVDSFYYTVDQVIGYTLFVLIAFLSFLGVVGVLQMKILFNDAFAQTAGHARIARAMKDNKVGFDMRGKPVGKPGGGGKMSGAGGAAGSGAAGGLQARSLVTSEHKYM
ncbi:hypothetical protein Vretimale_7896 [Volvox reticuliferus]|uniref:1,3-beta-glucan synthase n=1 Tax=Volvox reticuliferus TaxID=1737510 RepID=A0A8J4GAJ0_9CHLO|nr:hypothetical protein Vretifemale_5056 [Volvox reticuliferus]GIM03098.1 hypothetical protein Vretimale_7896 [Volvox reticuliferus]